MNRNKLVIKLTTVLSSMLLTSIAFSLAWFTPKNTIQSSDLSGSILREYFHPARFPDGKSSDGTVEHPYVITRPRHYENMIKLQYTLDEFWNGNNGGGYFFQIGYPLVEGDSNNYVYKYDENGKIIYDESGTGHTALVDTRLNIGNDIELFPLGSLSRPFIGHIEGNGMTIANFTVTGAGYADIGIFGYVGPTGTCNNLYFDNFIIDINGANASHDNQQDEHKTHEHKSTAYIGYLAGHIFDSATFTNVYVNNCKFTGSASMYSFTDNYGYYGMVERNIESATIGTGNNYKFNLNSNAIYTYLDDAWKNQKIGFEEGSDEAIYTLGDSYLRARDTEYNDEHFKPNSTLTQYTGNSPRISSAIHPTGDIIAGSGYVLGGKFNSTNSDVDYYKGDSSRGVSALPLNFSFSTLGVYGPEFETTYKDFRAYYDNKNGSYSIPREDVQITNYDMDHNPNKGYYFYYNPSKVVVEDGQVKTGAWEYYHCNNTIRGDMHNVTLKPNFDKTYQIMTRLKGEPSTSVLNAYAALPFVNPVVTGKIYIDNDIEIDMTFDATISYVGTKEQQVDMLNDTYYCYSNVSLSCTGMSCTYNGTTVTSNNGQITLNLPCGVHYINSMITVNYEDSHQALFSGAHNFTSYLYYGATELYITKNTWTNVFLQKKSAEFPSAINNKGLKQYSISIPSGSAEDIDYSFEYYGTAGQGFSNNYTLTNSPDASCFLTPSIERKPFEGVYDPGTYVENPTGSQADICNYKYDLCGLLLDESDSLYHYFTSKFTQFEYTNGYWNAYATIKTPKHYRDIAEEDSYNSFIADDPNVISSGYSSQNIDIVGGGITFSDSYITMRGEGSTSLVNAPVNGAKFYSTKYCPNSIILYVNNVPPDDDGSIGKVTFNYGLSVGALFGINLKEPCFKKGNGVYYKFNASNFGGNNYFSESSDGMDKHVSINLLQNYIKRAAYCCLDEDGNIVAAYNSTGGAVFGGGVSDEDIATYVLVLGVVNDGGLFSTINTRITSIQFEYKSREGNAGSFGTVDYRSASETVEETILNFYFTSVTPTNPSINHAIEIGTSFANGTYTISVKTNYSMKIVYHLIISGYTLKIIEATSGAVLVNTSEPVARAEITVAGSIS